MATILCLGSQFVYADGGITFTNIAANDGAGITYRRVGTPSRLAIDRAIFSIEIPVSLPIADIIARTPQKPHGAPGVAVFDYDNDGDLDIYVTNGPGKANSLYSNQLKETGKVSFIDVAEAAGVTATSQDSSGVCFGDIDNDGFQDLYVTGIGEDNILFHNNGNGTFTDITHSADIAAGSAHHSGCAMGDFNGDGFLDIVISNTASWDRRDFIYINQLDPGLEPNQLFMQDRSDPSHIHFVDVSETSGIQKIDGLPGGSWTWSVAAVDINQDGITDILFSDLQGQAPTKPSEDRGYNRLFMNDGTGHFTDVSFQANLNHYGTWMGLAFGDFNCDGYMDFFSTNVGRWIGNDVSSPQWFLGQKDGTFVDNDPSMGSLKALPFGWGDVAIDYDNDGDQDLIYYGDDDLLTTIPMDNPGIVLQNPGCSADFQLDLKALKTDHRFREVNGVAKGDFNNDGFEDIATVAEFQIVPDPKWFFPFYLARQKFGTPLDDIAAIEVEMTQRITPGVLTYTHPKLLRGDLAIEMNSANNGNNWAAVNLVGSVGTLPKGKSNRDGIGAVVKFTPEGGKTVITPIIGGGSHASQSYLTAEFGLGSAQKGTVDVLWPGGTHNRLYDVAKGERVKIPEIPCSYSASWKSVTQYNACVQDSLNRLTQAKVITRAEGRRLFDSASRAFGAH